jgi:hypothetical protein
MATKRLRKLVEDALDTPGAVRRIMKGPITLNKHSLNIKFNRTLTPKEKARLTRKLKKHMQSGNTRIKVRFIGKIKVGIDRNGDKRRVLNPLTGKRLIRGGQRYKFLTKKKGYREVRGILIPPEISNNKRNVKVFMNQFASGGATETVVTPVPVVKPLAPNKVPVNAKPVVKPPVPNKVPVNVKPAVKTPVPEKVPITLYNNNGKVVNKMAPGVVPVSYTDNSGNPVNKGTPGAVPVVYTNGKGGFVSPNTPGATRINLKNAPSLTGIAKQVNKTLVKDSRGILQKLTDAFKGPLPPALPKKKNNNNSNKKKTNNAPPPQSEATVVTTSINRKIANLTKRVNNVRKM